MDLDLGMDQVVLTIASSTSGYLVTFAPLFLFIGGLVLAIVVLFKLVSFINPGYKNSDFDPFD